MGRKPNAIGYTPEYVELARSTCLYIATKLGDLMEEIVIVGGLTPSLIIDQAALPPGAEQHVGTMDLDVGLSIALLEAERYRDVAERLRDAKFEPDKNAQGNPTRQRWRAGDDGVTVDFLIPKTDDKQKPGTLQGLEADFAALIARGLDLAFENRVKITLTGNTIYGEKAERDIGPVVPELSSSSKR